MTLQNSRFCVKSVAIIGAGPSGVAAAKYLLAEKFFSKVKVFEQRNSVGGIWNYTSTRGLKIHDYCGSERLDDSSFIPSPIYDGLESNIPLSIMQYSDFPFPKDTPILPDWQTIVQYLKDYAKDVEHLISFQQKVLDVRPEVCDRSEKWILTSLDLRSKTVSREVYDAVVVANGRYDQPYVPDITGLDAWSSVYPTATLHSKFYRNSNPFIDKKVVIVGYSSSGTDIGAQIEAVSQSPILVSQKSTGNVSPGAVDLEGKELVPEIEEFLVEDRAMRFSNGRVEKHVDIVLFCTGYSYSYPFLSSLSAFSDGFGNQDTWQHVFYIPRPTLAFVLLPLRVNAFPFSESQSAVIARVWSNRLALPDKTQMVTWQGERHGKSGSGKSFHKLGYPADINYMDEMLQMCMQATPKRGLINSGLGKLPPRWGEKERWTTQKMHEIKAAVRDKGDKRHYVKTLEDIGFDFDKWKEEHGVLIDTQQKGTIVTRSRVNSFQIPSLSGKHPSLWPRRSTETNG